MTRKYAILILSCLKGYEDFKSAQRHWIQAAHEAGVECYFVEGFGRATDPKLWRDISCCLEKENGYNFIRLDVDDSLKGTFLKTLSALRFLYEEKKVDVVYRTNLSSYIDVQKFFSFVSSNKIDEEFVGGVLGETRFLREYCYLRLPKILNLAVQKIDFLSTRMKFVSGSGFFLGSVAFSRLYRLEHMSNFIDDVGLSHYLQKAGVQQFSSIPRYWIGRGPEHNYQIDFQKFLELDGFHYRFKSKDRENDAYLMSHFHHPDFRMELTV